MEVSIRKFTREDIPYKVDWINNPENNRFLHYDLPLKVDNTIKWFECVQGRNDRYDATILVDGVPCGTIGLLNIDYKNAKCEYYVAMGEIAYKGKGVAFEASRQILHFAFTVLKVNRVYLYTEVDNIAAQKLFEKVGFINEGKLRSDIFSRGRFVDRYVYGICKSEFFEEGR